MSIRENARDDLQEIVAAKVQRLRESLAVTDAGALGVDGRCLAVAKTKLDEFEMWFEKAFKE